MASYSDYYDDFPGDDYGGMQSGWMFNGVQDPPGLVTRPGNYVPFQSLCWRDGRYAYDPYNTYPQYGTTHNQLAQGWTYDPYNTYPQHGTTHNERAQVRTPSARNFPRNRIVELQMRDQPDYGGIGDFYRDYSGMGDMYGNPGGTGWRNDYGMQWGNHGWW